MGRYAFKVDSDTLEFDAHAATMFGEELHDQYASAEPYHHICIDNAFPEEILEKIRQSVTQSSSVDTEFSAAHEFKKSQRIPERLDQYSRNFFYTLNSRPFLKFLESLTGINGLIPDPYFIGGGIHEVGTGGYLNIHADFNVHKPLNLERRLNVLIYMNRGWKEEYGGSFEIWDSNMKKKYSSFTPIFNRMVIFSTASDTMHGNPEPVAHPEGEPRRSMALYYYTATWDATRREHSTVFKGRPGSKDASGLPDRIDRIIDDVLPPIVNRQVKKVRRRLGV